MRRKWHPERRDTYWVVTNGVEYVPTYHCDDNPSKCISGLYTCGTEESAQKMADTINAWEEKHGGAGQTD